MGRTYCPRGIVVTALLVVALSAPASPPPALGDRVVEFCKANLGKKVGSGQCSALAAQALKAAGARPRRADSPNKGDYVWGKLVYLLEGGPDGPRATGKLNRVRPGDIIQYRDTQWSHAGFGHHTSVVASVNVKGNALKIFQQNFNNKQFVVEFRHNLANLKSGWIRIYRPIPAGK